MLFLTSAVLIIYLWFVLWLFRGLKKATHVTILNNPDHLVEFSIIIAAHNEENIIGKTLDKLIQQDYPKDKYEIVVVADRCNDRTVKIIKEKKKNFSMLKIIEIDSTLGNYSPKKYALKQGISQSNYPNLILMDADCIPGIHYLQTINKYFSVGIQVLVNIPKIIHGQKLLDKFLIFERIVTWSIAASGVGHGKPFLAFGGSMGYTRQLLEEVKNFDKISNSLSGDDDLLIYQMGTYNPSMAVCFDPEGWVKTPSPESLSVFFKQRRRHHSAGRYYSLRIKTGYFVFHLSNISLWILPFFYWPAIYVFMVKLIVDISFLKYAGRIFKEKISIMNFFLFEIGYVFHFAFVAPFGFIGRVKWK